MSRCRGMPLDEERARAASRALEATLDAASRAAGRGEFRDAADSVRPMPDRVSSSRQRIDRWRPSRRTRHRAFRRQLNQSQIPPCRGRALARQDRRRGPEGTRVASTVYARRVAHAGNPGHPLWMLRAQSNHPRRSAPGRTCGSRASAPDDGVPGCGGCGFRRLRDRRHLHAGRWRAGPRCGSSLDVTEVPRLEVPMLPRSRDDGP
jgi:hypothetical protein